MVKTAKETLRKKLKEKRDNLPKEEVEKLSRLVVERIKGLPQYRKAKTVMLYHPVGNEVDLTPLMEEIWRDPKKVLLLPKITADGEMVAVEVPGRELLRKGKFNIVEPIGGKIVKPEKIDFVAVPGVAFDKRGCRLGFGKGYYDRFLPRVKGFKAGVAYDFQVVDTVPCEGHDVPLDAVITPATIHYRKKEEKDA